MSDVIWFGFFGSSAIAMIAIGATVDGLRNHRKRHHLWWIIACAIIAVIGLIISVGLLGLWFVCSTQGCFFG
jgi:hypothetical protein